MSTFRTRVDIKSASLMMRKFIPYAMLYEAYMSNTHVNNGVLINHGKNVLPLTEELHSFTCVTKPANERKLHHADKAPIYKDILSITKLTNLMHSTIHCKMLMSHYTFTDALIHLQSLQHLTPFVFTSRIAWCLVRRRQPFWISPELRKRNEINYC